VQRAHDREMAMIERRDRIRLESAHHGRLSSIQADGKWVCNPAGCLPGAAAATSAATARGPAAAEPARAT
jgi:hypothetical protein